MADKKLYIREDKREIRYIEDVNEFLEYAIEHTHDTFKPSLGYADYSIEFVLVNGNELHARDRDDLYGSDQRNIFNVFDNTERLPFKLIDDLKEYGEQVYDFLPMLPEVVVPEYFTGNSTDHLELMLYVPRVSNNIPVVVPIKELIAICRDKQETRSQLNQ